MEDIIINDVYDRISKLLKNDQQYSYKEVGEYIIAYAGTLPSIESIYANYPAVLDIIELSAALEYGTSDYQRHIHKQVQYKLSELRRSLPDIR